MSGICSTTADAFHPFAARLPRAARRRNRAAVATPRLLVITAGFDTAAPERVLQKKEWFSATVFQDGSRTRASRIRSPLLYPLSYLYAQDGIRTRASGGSLLRSTSELPVRAVTDPSLEPVHGTQSQQSVVRRRPGLVIARNKKPLQSRDGRGSDRNSINGSIPTIAQSLPRGNKALRGCRIDFFSTWSWGGGD